MTRRWRSLGTSSPEEATAGEMAGASAVALGARAGQHENARDDRAGDRHGGALTKSAL